MLKLCNASSVLSELHFRTQHTVISHCCGMLYTTLQVQDYVLDKPPVSPLAVTTEVPLIGLRLERTVSTKNRAATTATASTATASAAMILEVAAVTLALTLMMSVQRDHCCARYDRYMLSLYILHMCTDSYAVCERAISKLQTLEAILVCSPVLLYSLGL
jgi:hypothetical protein